MKKNLKEIWKSPFLSVLLSITAATASSSEGDDGLPFYEKETEVISSKKTRSFLGDYDSENSSSDSSSDEAYRPKVINRQKQPENSSTTGLSKFFLDMFTIENKGKTVVVCPPLIARNGILYLRCTPSTSEVKITPLPQQEK